MLNTILNLARPQPMAADQRASARREFYNIVNYYRNAETPNRDDPYSRPLLIRYMYEYARSELAKDTFLRAFFAIMNLDEEPDLDLTPEGDQLQKKLVDFAEFLMNNFFIPLRAVGRRTAQPSSDRISALRGLCLMRDHHRCVVSRHFDENVATERLRKHGDQAARDDEGNRLAGQDFDSLEVAHIIPHSLTKPEADGQLSDDKKAALAILNMFDCDVSHIINGAGIDRPFNAISLTPIPHTHFGKFEIFFEPVPGQDNTYRIDKFLPATIRPMIPVTRTLYLADDKSIDPPSARLLAIHRAIAHILHLSGAGEYIDKILNDMQEPGAHGLGKEGRNLVEL